MLKTTNLRTSTSISIYDVIDTLYNVKSDLELLSNELAASGSNKSITGTKENDIDHRSQINKIVNLYKTLEEAVNNLNIFVKGDIDSKTNNKRIKRENSAETPENINNFKSEDNEHTHSEELREDNLDNDIFNEIKDEHKTENNENFDTNFNQELVKIEVDILPTKLNEKSSKIKVKKSSKKLNIKVITKEIEHENIDIINFKCHECNFTGDNLSDLKSHLVKVHPKMVYMCDKCNYVGATSSNVRDHYRSMHRGILYSCQNCDYSSKRPGDLKNHLENVHAEPFKCKHCEFSCKSKKYMRTHERFVHEKLGHNCDLCSYSAMFPKQLKDHMDAVHSNSIYQCEECEHTCASMKMLTHHYTMRHKNKEELLCSKCPYKTYADRYLKSHMKVHLEDEKRLVFCTECSYSAKNSTTLRKHIAKKHSTEPPKLKEYFCELCEYMAHDKNTLNQHRAFKHEGIMHGCPVCGLKYSRASLVYRHMRRKHPEEPTPNSLGVRSLAVNAVSAVEV